MYCSFRGFFQTGSAPAQYTVRVSWMVAFQLAVGRYAHCEFLSQVTCMKLPLGPFCIVEITKSPIIHEFVRVWSAVENYCSTKVIGPGISIFRTQTVGKASWQPKALNLSLQSHQATQYRTNEHGTRLEVNHIPVNKRDWKFYHSHHPTLVSLQRHRAAYYINEWTCTLASVVHSL